MYTKEEVIAAFEQQTVMMQDIFHSLRNQLKDATNQISLLKDQVSNITTENKDLQHKISHLNDIIETLLNNTNKKIRRCDKCTGYGCDMCDNTGLVAFEETIEK